ncbi:J domain-containing protein [Variovorax sp. LjRoot84]|uniref:J domain-containing protein n=1 Tax=Variovorax sp. LjRoot84 TaxID=3342340 RepID=UPI003ED06432
MNATAFPLTWPTTIPRSKEREKGKFQTTLAGALKNVDTSMQRFANDSGKDLTNIVISSNVTLGVQRPDDPGVAVWFTWDGLGLCIPVDRYSSVEGNLQAIHHIIEARRVELRHGTLALVRATFQGFKALPKPAGTEWRQVLGVKATATVAEVDAAYKRLASEHHPDKGGSTQKMTEINQARAAALKDRS